MPKLCICGGSGEIFPPYFANKISSGNRNPQGDGIEAEERAAAGRRISPEAVTEQKAGYQTADAFWTKVTRVRGKGSASIWQLELFVANSAGSAIRYADFAINGLVCRCRPCSWRPIQSFRSEIRKRQYLPMCRPGISPSRAFILSVFGCIRRRAAASLTSRSGSKSITGRRLGSEL
jgi:hypothetical protein